MQDVAAQICFLRLSSAILSTAATVLKTCDVLPSHLSWFVSATCPAANPSPTPFPSPLPLPPSPPPPPSVSSPRMGSFGAFVAYLLLLRFVFFSRNLPSDQNPAFTTKTLYKPCSMDVKHGILKHFTRNAYQDFGHSLERLCNKRREYIWTTSSLTNYLRKTHELAWPCHKATAYKTCQTSIAAGQRGR